MYYITNHATELSYTIPYFVKSQVAKGYNLQNANYTFVKPPPIKFPPIINWVILLKPVSPRGTSVQRKIPFSSEPWKGLN